MAAVTGAPPASATGPRRVPTARRSTRRGSPPPSPGPSPTRWATLVRLAKLDRFQQRHAVTAVPFAGRARSSATTTPARSPTLRGLLRLPVACFPLLLALRVDARFVARRPARPPAGPGRHGVRPVPGDRRPAAGATIGCDPGNVWALIIGVGGALWAGMGAMQRSPAGRLNETWAVPVLERPQRREEPAAVAGRPGDARLAPAGHDRPVSAGVRRCPTWAGLAAGLLAGTLAATSWCSGSPSRS